MRSKQDYERVEVDCVEALWTWLDENYKRTDGVWLVTFKKSAPDPADAAKYVSMGQILDALVAYGWIDGFRQKVDESRTQQLIFPRRATHWAKSYKDRAARLEQEGRMMTPGRARIEADKRSGDWDFMDDVDRLIIPEDLGVALAASGAAKENFEAMPDATKRFALRWIKLAKTSKTRAKRVAETARLAVLNQKVPGA